MLTHFRPAELVMIDGDESALHALQLSIEGRALLDTPDYVLCDIRDAEPLMAIFTTRRPEVVFHAAALKHLPVLERHPAEAVKTNVFTTRRPEGGGEGGSHDLRQHLHRQGGQPRECPRLLQEDRRAPHGSLRREVRGRLCERSVRQCARQPGVSSRHVQGQVEPGEPLTVTHPDVTRYFMTIPEAVHLIVQAGAIGQSGEIFILDMGEPIRIQDLALQGCGANL